MTKKGPKPHFDEAPDKRLYGFWAFVDALQSCLAKLQKRNLSGVSFKDALKALLKTPPPPKKGKK